MNKSFNKAIAQKFNNAINKKIKLFILFMLCIYSINICATSETTREITEYRDEALIFIDTESIDGFDEALHNYIEVVHNKDENIIFSLGNQYFIMGYYEKAYKTFSYGKDNKNIFGAATTARLMGDYQVAQRLYSTCITSNKNKTDEKTYAESYLGRALANRALAAQDARYYQDALADFAEYLKYNKNEKDNENVYAAIAGIYVKLKDITKAENTLEQGINAFPNSRVLRNMRRSITTN